MNLLQVGLGGLRYRRVLFYYGREGVVEFDLRHRCVADVSNQSDTHPSSRALAF
jgi:hypothetical protein